LVELLPTNLFQRMCGVLWKFSQLQTSEQNGN